MGTAVDRGRVAVGTSGPNVDYSSLCSSDRSKAAPG
jgi:hypothetical protein